MEDRWDVTELGDGGDAVAECVYCTRLIGAESSLVLHGGGNSSVKVPHVDVTGRSVESIRVKGSGWNMATIEAPGLTPLRLERLRELLEVEQLDDRDMVRELAAAKLDPGAPNPSVETLLHAFLPHRAVQHSHADVIVTLTNLSAGAEMVREVYGDDVVVVPYVMPGFDLARLVREVWPSDSHEGTLGMVLANHGLFTFGDDSAEAYHRHVDLISRAEQWLDRHAPAAGAQDPPQLPPPLLEDLATLRRKASEVAGSPLIATRRADPAVRRFVARPDLASLADRGPLTPDHVIRTKRVALVGRDIDGYVATYRGYVDQNRSRARTELTDLDPAPRIVLDPSLGMVTLGATIRDAQIAADIYDHTIPVLERAEDHLGGYEALSAADLFDMEYWVLEQAKLTLAGSLPALAGRVVLVTGAASGIGRACAAALMDQGACVAGLDLDEGVGGVFSGPAWRGVVGDATSGVDQAHLIRTAVESFGGVDHVVVSAGRFGPSLPIAELDPDDWRATMAVNVDAVADLFRQCYPILVESPVAASVVVIGSKNVAAPGRGAAAYSASKAALNQLCRVAALEWADDGIRVNVVHPDAVFDTGLWTDELIAERAARYDMTVDEYRRRNLLGAEVTSAHVARAVVALAGDDFAVTTGAQIPIDGGNDRVV